jgi:signal transduction histidine kinase
MRGFDSLKPIGLYLIGLLFCHGAWSLGSDLTLERLNHKQWTIADGAPSEVHGFAQTTDGTLRVGSTAGLFRFDGTRFVRYPEAQDEPLPAREQLSGATPLHPENLTNGSIGGVDAYFADREGNHLPIHATNLQIAYTAGSLTVPERVRFRYALEGSDRNWQDVGNRHEAVYTNPGPGRYTFRVIAANNDGVWNDTCTSIPFTIPPAFNQTKLFYTLCALLGLAALYALYKVRTRQLAAEVRGRLEARLAERERIARELHDTLLQGVQGLMLRFHTVASRISQRDPARALMEQALERADQVLGEGRDRVKELRATADNEADLPHALAAEGEQLALIHGAQFRTSVEGAHRDLHPIVRQEVLLITREALGNAFRHSGAQHIEAEISYAQAVLHVRIRDDGRGIDTDVLDAGGRPGHFGLLGMRERAEQIRAQLKIWSKPGAGTEIDVQVPASVAYRQSQNLSRRTWTRLGALLRASD